MMTLGSLKRMIEELDNKGFLDETPVLCMTQPSYPLQCGIRGYTTQSEICRGRLDDSEMEDIPEDPSDEDILDEYGKQETVFFVCSESTEYGVRLAWEIAEQF